jgi:hypothetical protein
MKFFIVLVILFVGEENPMVMQYKYGDFLEIETCDSFIEEQADYLKASIELQFPVETIQESVVMCMTQKEIDRVINHLEDKKWQEQNHI